MDPREFESVTPKHRHVCAGTGCDSYWVCSERDCDDRTWLCPTCAQQELDAYMNTLANAAKAAEETEDGATR